MGMGFRRRPSPAEEFNGPAAAPASSPTAGGR
jgi:hypothetical protein